MAVEKILALTTQNYFKQTYDVVFPDNQIQVQKTKKEFTGDLTIVVFPFVRTTKKSPEQTAEELGKALEKLPIIDSFNVVKGFLNLVVSNEYWLAAFGKSYNQHDFGFVKPNSTGKTVMVEYSSPNTNKPLHLGHIRNNLLGFSVSNILQANGHTVIKAQIINDRGIHICKSMLAWQKWGNGESPSTSGLKGDKLVGKYYVKYSSEEKVELQDLSSQVNCIFEFIEDFAIYPASDFLVVDVIPAMEKDAELFKKKLIAFSVLLDDNYSELSNEQNQVIQNLKFKIQNSLFVAAQEMLVKWEAKDKAVYELWATMNNWVYKGFDETYFKMGVNFDKLYYESDTYLTGKDVVAEGLKKGVFFAKEDGSVWIDLTEDGLDEKLVLRADGTAVYMTQDIGTAILRNKDYPALNSIVYTVGNEQDYHFKVLFLILKKLGYAFADNCFHLSYGMVDLPEGKMKSREGTVVDADDLIDDMVATATKTAQELGKLEGLDPEEKEDTYRKIGLGALKYFILKVDPKKRILFNPAESIDFQGNTGPFIQYTYARIQALKRKAGSVIIRINAKDINAREKELMKLMGDYPAIIKEAGDNYSPAIIANYTYDLVKEFNSYYQAVPILKGDEPAILDFRVALSNKVGKIIESSMQLLGVEVPQKM